MQVLMKRFPQCTIPTSTWSMSFQNLHLLLDILDRRQPRVIVELGSGISTLMIAAWFQERGQGRLISVDHDEDWANRTEFYVREAGISDYLTMLRTRLKSTFSIGHEIDWYDLEVPTVPIADIDLLVVDGPPAGTSDKQLSRIHSLVHFHRFMAADSCIVLDDACRPGESEVLKTWGMNFPDFKFQVVRTLKGFAIGERRARTFTKNAIRDPQSLVDAESVEVKSI
jgi:predicted O-methyltransferase YrrM